MKILITTGPTWEYLDPVRFITSGSTGTIGILLAKAFLKDKENKITMIAGPLSIQNPAFRIQNPRFSLKKVVSANDMFNAVKKIYRKFDVIIMAASVSDFRPSRKYRKKIKRNTKNNIIIKLVANPDILSFLGKNKRKGQILVGFSLESENLVGNTLKKFSSKKVDFIVANKLPAFGDNKISGYFIYDEAIVPFKYLFKSAVAKKIKEIVYEIYSRTII